MVGEPVMQASEAWPSAKAFAGVGAGVLETASTGH